MSECQRAACRLPIYHIANAYDDETGSKL